MGVWTRERSWRATVARSASTAHSLWIGSAHFECKRTDDAGSCGLFSDGSVGNVQLQLGLVRRRLRFGIGLIGYRGATLAAKRVTIRVLNFRATGACTESVRQEDGSGTAFLRTHSWQESLQVKSSKWIRQDR